MISDAVTFAPGSRLLIRDEEWLVKNALPTSTGGTAVRVFGLSELVRNHEAIFLSNIDKIEELKPEETKLVKDDSPQYRRSRLYLESLFRRTPPTDDKVYLGHQAALDYAPFQVTPAHKALQALRPRILIADGVGLGKTVEVGILMSELIKRGRGERILVVAIKSMLAQFQEEIWARFAIPLVRLDSVGLQRVRAKIPSNKNPFYYYDRVIISVDTLKNDAQYRHYLEQCHWDIIAIDECHNVANTGSQRNRLASLLARTCDSLILTSATPHNGRAESFANLMNMLEPTAIANESDYKAEEIEGLFVRRFKKDIEDQVSGAFSERETRLIRTSASDAEERFFYSLANARFRTLRRGRLDALYRINVLKGFLSSPDAALQTINGRHRRIKRKIIDHTGLEQEAGEDGEELIDMDWEQLDLFSDEDELEDQELADLLADKELLEGLRDLAEAVTEEEFTKYQRLQKLLRKLGATAGQDAPRVIIFSERLRTLRFLQEKLMAEFGVGEKAVVRFHAGLLDVRQQEIVESFGKEDSPIRILLASDVASEGVNLHYYCHLMIHFDIPWSLITMEQRNGRIDRYGQHTPPIIHYLLTESKNAELRGDLRVLERLIEKEQEAHKNIGDAATILKLYEAEQEEKHIISSLAEGKTAEEILPDEVEDDWLALMMNEAGAVDVDGDEDVRGAFTFLFDDDLSFAKEAFEEMRQAESQFNGSAPQPDYHPQRPEFSFVPPEDLRQRLEFIPREALPKNGEFRLTTDRAAVMSGMAEARKREGEWSQLQLFWELHPVMEWLTDKLLVRFGRHEAPLIISRSLNANTVILLFQGIVSNLRSQPLIHEWLGLEIPLGEGKFRVLSLEEVLNTTGFLAGLPNPQQETIHDDALLQALVARGVQIAREHMQQRRRDRGQALSKQLGSDMRKLKHWYDASNRSIAARQMNAQGAQYARLSRQQENVRALYEQRSSWLNDTLKTVNEPYLRLAAVFTEF